MQMHEVLVFPQGKGIMERDGPNSDWRFTEAAQDEHPEATLHMGVADPRHPDAPRHSQENRFHAYVRLDIEADNNTAKL